MNAIEEMITIALDKISKNFIEKKVFNNKGEIPREYKSYISAFGAASMQSGIMVALAFYHSEGEAGKKRKIVMDVVYEVLQEKYPEYKVGNHENLFKYVKAKSNEIDKISKQLMNAAIAVKLALRTFKFDK